MDRTSAVSYETFAEFYDAAMGDRSENVELLRRLIQKYSAHAKSILELAVGTGAILQGLAENYDVAGLDLSPKMLEIARGKVPEAELYEGNMSDFKVGRLFDVVICVFDSVNHLLKFEQWQSVFSHVADHL